MEKISHITEDLAVYWFGVNMSLFNVPNALKCVCAQSEQFSAFTLTV